MVNHDQEYLTKPKQEINSSTVVTEVYICKDVT